MWLVDNYVIDLFTIYHVLLWASFGLLMARFRMGLFASLGLGLLVGISWEIAELLWIEPWLGFREPWLNRAVADPIADVLGTWLGWEMGVALRKAYFGSKPPSASSEPPSCADVACAPTPSDGS